MTDLWSKHELPYLLQATLSTLLTKGIGVMTGEAFAIALFTKWAPVLEYETFTAAEKSTVDLRKCLMLLVQRS